MFWLKRFQMLLVAAMLVLATGAGQARPMSDDPPPGPPTAPGVRPGRPAFSKPARTTIRPGQSGQLIVLKFAEGSGVRLRPNGLESTSGRSLARIRQLLGGRKIERWFPRPEPVLDDERGKAQRRAGLALADLNLYYGVEVSNDDAAEALIDALNQEAVVELAYPAFLPAPPPVSPPLRANQGYLDAAPGLNGSYAWTKPGGDGTGIKIIDLEYSWNFSHEDLAAAAANPTCIYGTFYTAFGADHGTAVLGQLIATNNSIGVTGQAYGASVAVTCATDASASLKIAQSINAAAAPPHARPGDVILLEQQIIGPNYSGFGQDGLVPVEWDPATFDAIQSAVASGVNIVEAGANGSQNLDEPVYNGRFDRATWDSGAILVGAGGMGFAGGPSDLHAFGFSNYGSRFDLQAWGGSIYTTGYGYAYNAGGPNAYYTGSFGGTSGASPMIAAAVANLNGIHRAARAGAVLTPQAMRSLLSVTGTPQPAAATQKIGLRPNLVAAVDTLLAAPPPVTTLSIAGSVGRGDWYRSPVTGSFNVAGGVLGVSNLLTSYKLGGASATGASFTLSAQGQTTIEYATRDTELNIQEATNTQLVKIDSVPPSIQLDPLPPVLQSPVSLAWSGADALSGIAGYMIETRLTTSSIWTTVSTAPPATSAVLTLPAGDYEARLSAADVAGNASTYVTRSFTVAIPPSITTQPSSQSVRAGQSLTLMVAAEGTQPLSYQWRKDGQPIAGATTTTYTVPAVTASDAGSYDVVVTNIAGSITSAQAAVTVSSRVYLPLVVRQ